VRTRDPADRRHIVEITKTGRKASCEVENAIAEEERDIFADLDEAEVAQLHGLLSRLQSQPSDGVCGE
jgi:DNA-binding MarR family transcriptional regulator